MLAHLDVSAAAMRALQAAHAKALADGVAGASILDTKITGIDQRTPLCIGSASEVDRFNLVLGLGK